jgi:hypothetical protein
VSKFVVADQSLSFVGGHYFEYATQMLAAAEQRGLQPFLGAHHDLGHDEPLLENREVIRAFRGNAYASVIHKLQRANRRVAAAGLRRSMMLRRWRGQIDCWRYGLRYRRVKREYAQSLDQIWAGSQLAPGDHFFLATTNPLDLAGLAGWARENPAARDIHWHLQIHFPLVDTETWYARESRQFDDLTMDSPAMLQDLLQTLPRSRVHLYTTTDSLAGQLQHYFGESFQTLPYPVSPTLATLRDGVQEKRLLRARCAGDARVEKGAEYWPHLVAALKDDYFATGRLQLALQTKSVDELPESLRKLIADCQSPAGGQSDSAPVVPLPWPLAPAEYLQYLAGSDIGLLMYDPLIYQVRCSGVLVEMLSAGVPVVAPAGCWLADQIAEPIFAHQEHLRDRLPVVANLTTGQLDWQVAAENRLSGGITVGVDTPCAKTPAVVTQVDVPTHAKQLLILLKRDEPNPWNRYLSVSVEQRGDSAGRLKLSRDIVGHRSGDRPATVLVPLDGRARRVEIRLQTAFGHEPLTLRKLDCCFLASGGAELPRGAVGLLSSDRSQVPELLRNVVDHYDHYAKTARKFAATWAPIHTARQVLADLLERAGNCELAPQEQAA